MKYCSKCKETKPLESFSKKRTTKDGLSHWCKSCCKISKKKYYEENKEKVLSDCKKYREDNKEWKVEYDKKYLEENRERLLEYKREYYQKNKEKAYEDSKAWKAANPDKVKGYARVATQKHRARNAFLIARRRAKKKNATPLWANKKAIQKFYESAHGISMLLGEWYHVDHIVPLVSKYVCGLHCEANLRVIEASENQTKSNRWWPDMWEPVPLEEITNGL